MKRQVPASHLQLLDELQDYLRLRGIRGWIVGGYVRDLLLDHPSSDMDIAIDSDATGLARSFADATGGSWVPLDDERGVARIVWTTAAQRAGWPHMLDLVRLRAPDLEGDLRGRDFTINAIALSLDDAGSFTDEQLIDPLGGIADLRQRIIRVAGPTALSDDPLRMLRAVRLAATLQLQIAPEVEAEIRAEHHQITRVAAERVRDEFIKLLTLPRAAQWLEYLDDVRLLTTLIPELEPARDCTQPGAHYLSVLPHLIETVAAAEWLMSQMSNDERDNLQASAPVPDAVRAIPELTGRLPYTEQIRERLHEQVDNAMRSALFKLAVLLHDVAKPQTKAIKPDGGLSFYNHPEIGAKIAYAVAQRLRVSRAGADYIRTIVREHMRPGQLSELGPGLTHRAIYRFFRATGAAGPEVLLHSLADHLATRGPQLRPEGWYAHLSWTGTLLELYYEAGETLRPQPLVRGDDLIQELQLAPGPIIGHLLEEIREGQAAGEVRTRDDALALARQVLLVTRQGPLVGQQEDEQRT